MRILDYLTESSVLFPSSTNKQEILTQMAAKASQLGHGVDVQAFTKAIFEREAIMSTGIGLQIAIPHAKLPAIEDFFVVAAILGGDAEWDALDKKPVQFGVYDRRACRQAVRLFENSFQDHFGDQESCT